MVTANWRGCEGTFGGPQEILVPSGVADYVGVQPGAEGIVEFVYNGPGEPIIERFDGLRLIGTFDMAGPDQGRFEPFWRFNARGQDVLTVRADTARIGITSLPIVLNRELFQKFLSSAADELARRGAAPAPLPGRDQLVVRASTHRQSAGCRSCCRAAAPRPRA